MYPDEVITSFIAYKGMRGDLLPLVTPSAIKQERLFPNPPLENARARKSFGKRSQRRTAEQSASEVGHQAFDFSVD